MIKINNFMHAYKNYIIMGDASRPKISLFDDDNNFIGDFKYIIEAKYYIINK